MIFDNEINNRLEHRGLHGKENYKLIGLRYPLLNDNRAFLFKNCFIPIYLPNSSGLLLLISYMQQRPVSFGILGRLLCYSMLFYAMLCYAMFFYAMLR